MSLSKGRGKRNRGRARRKLVRTEQRRSCCATTGEMQKQWGLLLLPSGRSEKPVEDVHSWGMKEPRHSEGRGRRKIRGCVVAFSQSRAVTLPGLGKRDTRGPLGPSPRAPSSGLAATRTENHAAGDGLRSLRPGTTPVAASRENDKGPSAARSTAERGTYSGVRNGERTLKHSAWDGPGRRAAAIHVGGDARGWRALIQSQGEKQAARLGRNRHE